MKRLIVSFIAVIALAVPGVAEAHSGSVTCNTTGVVFSYHADFPVTTQVTEHVGSFTKSFTVPARTAVTDTIPDVTGTIVASSTWSGGGTIPPTSLTCPTPPPATPVCNPGDVSGGIVGGVLVCTHTVTNTVTLPAPPAPICIPTVVTKTVVKYKTRVKIKWKTRIKLIPYTPVLPPKHPRGGGTAG